jgi:hypothetical protein
MFLTFGSNDFFSTKFSTFLTQKIGENLDVFVVLSVHLNFFFSFGEGAEGVLPNFLYQKIKKKNSVQHIIFTKEGKIKETNVLFVKSKRCQQPQTA